MAAGLAGISVFEVGGKMCSAELGAMYYEAEVSVTSDFFVHS